MSDASESEAMIAESESNCRDFIQELQREIEKKTTLLFQELESRITTVACNARAEVQETESVQEDYMEGTRVFNQAMNNMRSILDTCANIIPNVARGNKRKISRVSTSTSPHFRGSRANSTPTLKPQNNQGHVDNDIGYDGSDDHEGGYNHGSGTYDLEDDPAAEVSPSQANRTANRNGGVQASSSSSPLSSRFIPRNQDPLDMETQEQEEQEEEEEEVEQVVVDDPETQNNGEGLDETQWPSSNSVDAFATDSHEHEEQEEQEEQEQQEQHGGGDLREEAAEAREVDELGPDERGGDGPGTGLGVRRGTSSSEQERDEEGANVDLVAAPGVMPPFCSSAPSSSSLSSASSNAAGDMDAAGPPGVSVTAAEPGAPGGGVMPLHRRATGKGKGKGKSYRG